MPSKSPAQRAKTADRGYGGKCQRAVSKWEGIQKAVYAEQEIHSHANMWAALDYVVGRDQQLPLIGDLRLALNAIRNHMGIISGPKTIRVSNAAAA